jgi:uncharacterized membrane protein/protein-disulfide isomerase
MARRKSAPEQPLSRGTIVLLRLLLAAALLLSLYLGYVSFGGSAVAGCGPDSGCDKVLHSRWSKWFGIPVSLPAVLVYGLMLAAALRLTPAATAAQKRQAWSILLPASWAVIGAVVWFVTLQMAVIKAVCPFCMAAHACGFVAALLVMFRAPVRDAPEKSWQQEKQIYLPPKDARRLTAVALASAAILIAGQVIYRPRQFQVTPVGEATLEQTPTNRFFQIYEGRFAFNLNEVPVIGSPAAPYAMVSLFDYTCHHCRIMHDNLKQVHKTFGNQLAIVSLPMPLDRQCNYTVQVTAGAHSNACEYARLGLAVWRANRTVHPQFDDWLFQPEHPPDLATTRDYAARLVGAQKLDALYTNQWVEAQLQLAVNLFATNFIHVHQGSMPQVIIGTNLLTGTVAPEEIYRRLENQLGLRATNLISQAQ